MAAEGRKPRARSRIVTTVYMVDLLTGDAHTIRRWARSRGWTLKRGVRELLTQVAKGLSGEDAPKTR